jgi:hypothetical protein
MGWRLDGDGERLDGEGRYVLGDLRIFEESGRLGWIGFRDFGGGRGR